MSVFKHVFYCTIPMVGCGGQLCLNEAGPPNWFVVNCQGWSGVNRDADRALE
jgi:hypothetical protein